MQNQVLQNAHKKVKMQNFLLSGSANSLLKNKNAERLLRCSWGRPLGGNNVHSFIQGGTTGGLF